MSGIAFEHVTKVFADGTVAVADLDLRIADGEFCVLLGPSGCGKSTVLRLVAGLAQVSRGTVRIGDLVVNDTPPRDRGVAMVFETHALYPHMTVAENMDFGLRAQVGESVPRQERVQRTAGRLGLGQLLARRPRELSDGERQRAALGRAIVRRPRAFLMDEPLSNLDASMRVAMRSSIGRLRRELGTTVLYVTHDQTEAMSLADRIVVMREGHVEQVGEPQALYDRPATLFAASFLGSPPMNLWHVRLAEHDGRVILAGGTRRMTVPEAVVRRLRGLRSHVGGHLVLGLRPEAIGVDPSRTTGRPLDLPVTAVEPLGHRVLVHLEAEGAGLQLAESGAAVPGRAERIGTATFVRREETLVASLPAHERVRPGELLRVYVDLERAHFFDPATHAALA